MWLKGGGLSCIKTYFQDVNGYFHNFSRETLILRLLKSCISFVTLENIAEDKQALENDWEVIKSTILDALIACVDFRKKEGEVLEGKLLEYISTIEKCLEKFCVTDKKSSNESKITLGFHYVYRS